MPFWFVFNCEWSWKTLRIECLDVKLNLWLTFQQVISNEVSRLNFGFNFYIIRLMSNFYSSTSTLLLLQEYYVQIKPIANQQIRFLCTWKTTIELRPKFNLETSLVIRFISSETYRWPSRTTLLTLPVTFSACTLTHGKDIKLPPFTIY